MSFLFKINLNDGSNILSKELKVKHLKTIHKCLLGDDPDIHLLYINLNYILKKLTNQEIDNINFIDYFIILLNLRCLSIGNTVSIQLTENTTFEIDLNKIIEEIKKIKINELLKFDKEDDIAIDLKIPSILDIIEINNDTNKIYNYFIKGLSVKDKKFVLNSLHEKEEILKKLPAKHFSQITKKINEIANYFNNINLLDYNKHLQDNHNISLHFNFNIKNLFVLTKLLFGDQLLSLYENIFGLCKVGNFTPEYIENCTPGEYYIFIKKIQETNKQQTNQDQQTQQYTEEESIYDEPINPYESDTPLPPITSEFNS